MRDGDQLRPLRDQLVELVDDELAAVGHRRPRQNRAFPLAQEMPRHDIGVVLHDRDEDFVALADPGFAERPRDEIDGARGIAREDDLVRMLGVEEAAHRFARSLVMLGRRRSRDNAARDARWRIRSDRRDPSPR